MSEAVDCNGGTLKVCPDSWTGVGCDIPCTDAACSCNFYCHSDGRTYGVSTVGAYLFPLSLADSPPKILAQLRTFIVQHPETVGVAPGVSSEHLGLAPSVKSSSKAGALTIFRYEQTYRDVPVFGPDFQVTMIATEVGAIGLRGSIVDSRSEFAHIDDACTATVGRSAMIAHGANLLGVDADLLSLHFLRFVALPGVKVMGWAGNLSMGSEHMATIVIEADPKAEIPPVRYFSRDTAAGIETPLPVEVLAEDFGSVIHPEEPIEAALASELYDGSPLQGSTWENDAEVYQLATEQLVQINAEGMSIGTLTLAAQGATPVFMEAVGSSSFEAQSMYVMASNFYALTHTIMEGAWESANPVFAPDLPSKVNPATYQPRTVLYSQAGNDACGQASFCVRHAAPPVSELGFPSLPEILRHPTLAQAPNELEVLATLRMEVLAPLRPDRVGHEFGHVVDLFAKPGFIDSEFGCLGANDCLPSCQEDTTDEASLLRETWANLLSLWYIRSLFSVAAESDYCVPVESLDLGANKAAHHPSCRLTGSPYSLLLRNEDPACSDSSLCDKPGAPGFKTIGGEPAPTGLCAVTSGYRTGSFTQALWELLHGEECSESAPYVCESLPALTQESPPKVVGEALLYALRVNSASYRGFADDMATYTSCNYSADVYEEMNAILCHHAIRPCEAPPPVQCSICGNGVLEGEEDCEGGNLGGESCLSLGFDNGDLSCTDECSLDTALCTTETTGSGGASATATTTTGAPPADDGCQCKATNEGEGAPVWAALIALVAGGRRRRSLGRVAAVALLAVCGDHATSCNVGIRVVYYCKDSAADGQEECDDQYGTVIGQEVCFGGATGAPTYPNWDPDASITLVSGVYEVDSDLLDEVREDFNVVTQEDSSKLLLLTGGYAEIVSINSNDMAHHLGLQNDDVILSVSDGVTGTIYLNSWADYAYAIATYNSAISLSVIVDRGGTNVTLDYSII